MSTEYSFRPYEEGDAAAVNHLYETITGRKRSVAEFEWQWLRAPGGEGEIWLIEATTATGRRHLVGHHGIMPLRFSSGPHDLLFGKTENTMLLPEYRSKILYPRFEKRFADRYESRFDALFSTVGPPAAIRQRRAMGYESAAHWVHVRVPTHVLGAARFLLEALRRRLVGAQAGRGSRVRNQDRIDTRKGKPGPFRALDGDRARNDAFFRDFWEGCRASYGLTPRRDAADLDWRFWSNPHCRHIALVNDSDERCTGYVVIRKSAESPAAAIIEDIVPRSGEPAAFHGLLDSALSWMSDHGIHWADFWTTDDACQAGGIAQGLVGRNMRARRWISRLRNDAPIAMPRKITDSGRERGLVVTGWYVTPMVFEGRGD